MIIFTERQTQLQLRPALSGVVMTTILIREYLLAGLKPAPLVLGEADLRQ